MRIRSKLLLNAVIVLSCLSIVGGVGFVATTQVANLSTRLVEMEVVPLAKINKLEGLVWNIWLRLLLHTGVSEVETMQQLTQEIQHTVENITKLVQEIETIYRRSEEVATHQQILLQFSKQWQELQPVVQKILQLSQEFTKEDALRLIVQEEQTNYNQLIESLHQLSSSHRVQMEDLRKTASDARQEAMMTISTLTLLISLGVLWLMNRFSRRLLTPLLHINNHLKWLSQGQVVEADIEYSDTDEISEIVDSSRLLRNSVKSTIGQANAIAAGNYSRKVELLSEQDQLGRALSEMTQTLHEVTGQNAVQNWLKTGQTQLHDQMSGDQNLVDLAHNIISFLTLYVDAQVGLFYGVEKANLAQHLQVKLLASYAYTRRKNLADEFEFSEGLVERAARMQKSILLTINSGLGEDIPRQVFVIPFLFENAVKGVIQLGSAEPLTEVQQEFLQQVMPNIGIAVSSIEARTKMQELLQQTQVQADALQLQKEELQHQKEELQAQTEELQAQTEELQSQTEELRHANEESEERAKELEQQKNDIRQKNVLLEKTQKEMVAKAQELERASKYKSEFLANMSHELRTPLNSMLILAQLLAENKGGNLDEKQVEYAHTIHSAGADLLTLINEILDLSKVEAGKVEVHSEEVSLGELTAALDQKFRPLAVEKGLAFSITTAQEVPAGLQTDVQRLKQILNNLLSNAFKFTSQGEVKLTITKDVHHFQLVVTDTGIGIPKDKQTLIFEAFQQADSSTSRRYGGTGLGLTISRQLARLLGGDIRLQSEEGQGSAFTLWLPDTLPKSSVDNLPQSLPLEPPKTQLYSSPFAKTVTNVAAPVQAVITSPLLLDDRDSLQPGEKSILIIEDDRRFSSILIELAHEKRFKCLVAEDGKTGLQLAEQYQPQAIILDVGLPQINGWQVMEKLKENPNMRHIPVHFMSATDQHQDAKQMGAIGYLLKPVSMEQLGEAFTKIEEFLAKTVKCVLVVVEEKQRLRNILDLIGDDVVQTTCVATTAEALARLHKTGFDCMVLDVEVEQASGLKLLEQLEEDASLLEVPVIVYAERDLTVAQEAILKRCADHLTIKSVRTPARLLEEATLFLHQLETLMPKEKRQMLQMLHDKEALLKGKKVLIVDDDTRNTFALVTVLEDKEMKVIAGKNGKEALELLEEHPDVDIVLMDIMMPEMDGYEATRHIRAQLKYRKLPIIALTAKAMKGDKAKCIDAGANDYLSKPIDMDRLLSLMRVWLYQ